jgi:hypothetical protein
MFLKARLAPQPVHHSAAPLASGIDVTVGAASPALQR